MLRLRLRLRLKYKTSLNLKTMGEARGRGARRTCSRAVTGILAMGLAAAGAGVGRAQATSSSSGQQTQTPQTTQPATPISSSKIGPSAPVTYLNRYEVFGGLNFQNFMAGQHLPNKMNLGGGEILGTYWLTRSLGLSADYRFDAGTTPVFANGGTTPISTNGTGVNNRPLVYLHTGMLGAQYRGPKNQYAAIDYHALFGVARGTFDYSLKNVFPQDYSQIGVYTNRTKPIAALGGSIDFNLSKKMAIRFSPDLILEHFGTETREFFAISGGVIYRFGKK
jgi:hypothetical protein